MRFTEKHIIENLDVENIHPLFPLKYHLMLNQGNKRGK